MTSARSGTVAGGSRPVEVGRDARRPRIPSVLLVLNAVLMAGMSACGGPPEPPVRAEDQSADSGAEAAPSIRPGPGEPPRDADGEAGPIVVGLLRADCVALPFARFEAGQWTRLPFWTPPAEVANFHGPWYHVGGAGGATELTSGPVVSFETGGDSFYEGWGLATDHAPCTAPAGYPVERIGLILDRPLDVAPFSAVGPGASLRRDVAEAVLPVFEREEAGALSRLRAAPGGAVGSVPPDDAGERRREPLHLDRVLAASFGDTTLLYVVARREYALPHPDWVRPVSVLHGWMVRHGDALTFRDPELVLDTELAKARATYEPSGTFTVAGARYVVAELRRYESSVKQVLRVSPAGLEPVLRNRGSRSGSGSGG